MASPKYVFNETRGCYTKLSRGLKGIHENCAYAWVEEGISIRDLTIEESIAARNAQAKHRELSQEVLGRNDIHGLRFERPKGTTYQQPWVAYEEMEAPMGVRYCRWPRRTQEAMLAAA